MWNELIQIYNVGYGWTTTIIGGVTGEAWILLQFFLSLPQILMNTINAFLVGIVAYAMQHTAWVAAAVNAVGALLSMVYALLPSEAQSILTGAGAYLASNPVITTSFHVMYWVLDQFINMGVVLGLAFVSLQVYAASKIIHLAKTVYDLIPTRG